MPFIQSVYCCSVRTSASGSACAENVASGLQYCRQPSHPFPVSHAAKKSLATAVIVDAIAHLSVMVCAAPSQAGALPSEQRRENLLSRSRADVDPLFDDVIRSQQQRRRERQAERPGRLEIDHELKLGRLLDGEIGG